MKIPLLSLNVSIVKFKASEISITAQPVEYSNIIYRHAYVSKALKPRQYLFNDLLIIRMLKYYFNE